MKPRKTTRLYEPTEYIYTEEAKAKDLAILNSIKSMADGHWVEIPKTPAWNFIGNNQVLIGGVFNEQLATLTIRDLTLDQVTAIFEILKKGK